MREMEPRVILGAVNASSSMSAVINNCPPLPRGRSTNLLLRAVGQGFRFVVAEDSLGLFELTASEIRGLQKPIVSKIHLATSKF
jgi:hypothetical protein